MNYADAVPQNFALEYGIMENNNGAITSPVCAACGGEPVLAMARVTVQPWPAEVYDGETVLSRGTLFPALDLPFIGKEVR